MADLLLLSPCPSAAQRVRGAVRAESINGVFHSLRVAQGWAELTALAPAAVHGLAFVDPYHGGAFGAAEIRRLRQRAPALEVVAYADFTGRPPADVFSLAHLGVRAVVCPGRDDNPNALARCLHDHLNRGPLEDAVQRLEQFLPGPLHRWLGAFLLSASTLEDVPQLARVAGCSPRTLRRSLQSAGLPSPEDLLAWRRLLHAARLLDDRRSADSVARTLEFSSGSALRKSMKRLTGLRPGDLARGGGLRLMSSLFLAECGAALPADAAA